MMVTKSSTDEDAAYSLVFFRIVFGLLMLFSMLRFIAKGWVYQLYIQPKVYFPFLNFDWLKPLPGLGMYAVFSLLAVLALGIAFGKFYRLCIVLFFLLFTYVELLDKSNYLNHYYFVSLLSLLLCFLPTQKSTISATQFLWLLRLQVGLVYVFAGIAKIKSSWLLDAQPLQIWFAANSSIPLVGGLLEQNWLAYVASWFAMLFDLTIPFWLLYRRTTLPAYLLLLVFHLLTSVFFYIGLFPLIMSTSALIFFSSDFHKIIVQKIEKIANQNLVQKIEVQQNLFSNFKYGFLVLFFLLQLLIPFRYLLYNGNVLWTEQGYRFSWNVMLMEKTGLCEFVVKDGASEKVVTINNREYLTPLQEKMVSTQPDMILQYAHILAAEFEKRGFENAEVYADCYVALNGKSSKQLVDTKCNLAKEYDDFKNKKWILSSY